MKNQFGNSRHNINSNNSTINNDKKQTFNLDENHNNNQKQSETISRSLKLLQATAAEKWEEVKRILDSDTEIDVNIHMQDGIDKGKTILWWLSYKKKWELVKYILEEYPNANVNAVALEGGHKGKSVLWLATDDKQWNLAQLMIKSNPDVDINAAPQNGEEKGKSILWHAAHQAEWEILNDMLTCDNDWKRAYIIDENYELVEKMQARYRNANINAAPYIGDDKGKTVLWYIAYNKQWKLLYTLLNDHSPSDDVPANINAMPQQEKNSGESILWYAVTDQEWDIVRIMLEKYPTVDVKVSGQQDDEYKGVSALELILNDIDSSAQSDILDQILNFHFKSLFSLALDKKLSEDVNTYCLSWLARRQQWKEVERILEKYPETDVNAAPFDGDDKGKSILWWAVYSGYLKYCMQLSTLQKDARIARTATNKMWELITKLLKYPNADINITSQEGEHCGKSVLWWIAASNQWDLVKNIIKTQPRIYNAIAQGGEDEGKSILWLAVYQKKWGIVIKLLDLHSSMEAFTIAPPKGDYKDKSVWMLLNEEEQLDDKVIKKILKIPKIGIKIISQRKEFQYESDVWIAAYFEQWDLVKELIKDYSNIDINAIPREEVGKGKSVLWVLSYYKQWDLVRELIKKYSNIDVNATPQAGSYKGKTVLWLAAYFQQQDLVRELIKNHPNIDIRTAPQEGVHQGKTVLWLAAYFEQWDLVKELIKKYSNIDVNATPQAGSYKGKTVLWLAAYFQQQDLVRELIKNHPNIDINAVPQEGPDKGKTVLVYAAARQDWQTVKVIISERPDISIQDISQEVEYKGQSILWLTAKYQEWGLFNLILKKCSKVEINATPLQGGDEGKSILWWIAKHQKWDLFKEILNYPNIQIHATSKQGMDKGISILGLVVIYKQWDLFKEIIKKYTGLTIDLTTERGSNGKSILQILADCHQWGLIHILLKTHTYIPPKILQHCGSLNDKSFEELLISLTENKKFEQLTSFDLGIQNNLSAKSITLLLNIFDTHPNCITIQLISTNISQSEIERLYKLFARNQQRTIAYNKANLLLNKSDNLKSEELTADDLSQALQYAEEAAQLNHPYATALIEKIKIKVVEIFCSRGQPKEAIDFVEENFSVEEKIKHKGLFYFQIGEAFINDTTEEVNKKLIKACVFLSEAYLMLDKKSELNKDAERLLNKLLNQALGNTIMASFDEIQRHPHYSQLLETIIHTKKELLCGAESPIPPPSDISNFCNFIQSKNIPLLESSLCFWNLHNSLKREYLEGTKNNNTPLNIAKSSGCRELINLSSSTLPPTISFIDSAKPKRPLSLDDNTSTNVSSKKQKIVELQANNVELQKRIYLLKQNIYQVKSAEITKVQAVFRGYILRRKQPLNHLAAERQNTVRAQSQEVVINLRQLGKYQEADKLVTALERQSWHEAMQIICGNSEQYMQFKNGTQIKY